MLDKKTKDLFEETTMTFGEHLEELRTCLFRALVGLMLGFLVGLYYGGDVVDFIQQPLKKALTSYYERKSETDVAANLQALEEVGYSVDHGANSIERVVADQKLMFQKVYVNPNELVQQLKKADPEQFASVPIDKGKAAADLVPVYFWYPLETDSRVQTKSLNAHEAFSIYIKAALLVGVLLSSPWIFWQIWTFVAAGLYPREKRYVHVFLPFSLGLFFAGAAVAFFFVFEPVLTFLFRFNESMGIDPDPRISEWLGFVMVLPIGFGIGFQLPLVMLFLERIGIFDVEAYRSKWRIAILVIAVLSAVLTPPDPWSMLLMAVPLTGLYFGGILLCKFLPRIRSPYEEWDED